MIESSRLLTIVAPVFVLIAIGVLLRRLRWLTAEADASLLKVGVNVLFPCLTFQTVLGSAALRDPRNLVWPPLLGFVSMGLGWLAGWWGGKALGLERGKGLRTFGFTVGFYNYGYMAIPLVKELFGDSTLGVLFVHNVGVEIAIWTVGVMMLAGTSLRESWRNLFNGPLVALVLGLACNWLGVSLPAPVTATVRALADCAVPLALVLIGAFLEEHLRKPAALWSPRVVGGSVLLRLAALPWLYLVAAKFLPFPAELKQVMIVQAAMPAGVFPIVLAKHYAGQPLTAAQVVIGTIAASIPVIPLWIKFGLWWVAP